MGSVLKTLPDGAELTVVGPDQETDGRAWRNVRDAEDATGWMAAEVLAPLDSSEPPPASTAPPTQATSPGSAAPCRPGQIKGNATTGLFYRPDHPDYEVIRERVRCFETEPQARASGF
ncbi:MAG: hypothetical protein H0V51_01280, partial [Chloroflexi bacterium]|nr:hypothetical protein [Chloroflexota bacterium]